MFGESERKKNNKMFYGPIKNEGSKEKRFSAVVFLIVVNYIIFYVYAHACMSFQYIFKTCNSTLSADAFISINNNFLQLQRKLKISKNVINSVNKACYLR
jgi:hypothetical protein